MTSLKRVAEVDFCSLFLNTVLYTEQTQNMSNRLETDITENL